MTLPRLEVIENEPLPQPDIRYALGTTSLGFLLVAVTNKGLCALLLGDDPTLLVDDLKQRFTQYEIADGGADLQTWVRKAEQLLESPTSRVELPLDVDGTPFQLKVWQTLRTIPPGSAITYSELAQRIGSPNAARAVATACAANPVAVVIPCHRVVRADRSLAGYRWGIKRKAELLRREGWLPLVG